MKFTLSTTDYFYKNEEKIKALKEVGFTFKKSSICPSHMEISGEPEIEINSLSELMDFVDRFGQIVLDDGYIEIYDGYRE